MRHAAGGGRGRVGAAGAHGIVNERGGTDIREGGADAQRGGIELNEGFRQALSLMEGGRSVFVTGRAGTGKSTLLRHFRATTKRRVAVLAPTGVAALNAGGQTIHSFFRWKPDITPSRVGRVGASVADIYKKLEALVIDEVSMVRADLLDCVDRFLRLNGPDPAAPFGGLQMIFIGDLYQLPPVATGTEAKALAAIYATPFFFSAHALRELDFEIVELEKVYRQQHDPAFLEILNAVRNATVTEEQLARLNERCLPGFEPPPDELCVFLTTTNALAEELNRSRLQRLRGKAYTFHALVEGDFGKEYLPAPPELTLKPGAQVMLVNNDPQGRWVNGSLGRVTRVLGRSGEPAVQVELEDGDRVEVEPHTWELFELFVEAQELRSRVVGRYTQFPLVLGWAVTIHKAQGKTFPRAVIDLGRGAFAPGQVYVALSRCTSLTGLVLRRLLTRRQVWSDRRVMKFLTAFHYRRSEEALPLERKRELVELAIREGKALRIVYLKPNDEKSERVVWPRHVGEAEYGGRTFLGLRAYCALRGEERTFRLDRILSLEPAPEEASHPAPATARP